jgi:hypothetical protein
MKASLLQVVAMLVTVSLVPAFAGADERQILDILGEIQIGIESRSMSYDECTQLLSDARARIESFKAEKTFNAELFSRILGSWSYYEAFQNSWAGLKLFEEYEKAELEDSLILEGYSGSEIAYQVAFERERYTKDMDDKKRCAEIQLEMAHDYLRRLALR